MKTAYTLAAGALLLAPVAAQAGGGSPAPDPAPVRSTPFPDVPKDHWAYDAVEQLRQAGILRGYPPSRPPAPASTRPTRRGAAPRHRRATSPRRPLPRRSAAAPARAVGKEP